MEIQSHIPFVVILLQLIGEWKKSVFNLNLNE